MRRTKSWSRPCPDFWASWKPDGRRANRLDLANWLVSPQNPLTARAFVNRLWRQFFGTGISKVLEDLGSQGEWPMHPELIDWMAAEFMHPEWNAAGAHDWDMRHLVRTIVTSHTYRQSSLSNAQIDERDPDNRLLARQSRYRVDAEIVHDIALSVSGLLVEEFRRTERTTVRAGRLSGRHEFSEARIFGQPRRRSVPPRAVHGVAADVPASHACSPSTRLRARSAR